jgi:hypothetical protein
MLYYTFDAQQFLQPQPVPVKMVCIFATESELKENLHQIFMKTENNTD